MVINKRYKIMSDKMTEDIAGNPEYVAVVRDLLSNETEYCHIQSMYITYCDASDIDCIDSRSVRNIYMDFASISDDMRMLYNYCWLRAIQLECELYDCTMTLKMCDLPIDLLGHVPCAMAQEHRHQLNITTDGRKVYKIEAIRAK